MHEKNAQWETVTGAVHPDNLVRCKRSDVEDLQSENIRLTAQIDLHERQITNLIQQIEKYKAALDEIMERLKVILLSETRTSRTMLISDIKDVYSIARQAREGD